MEMKKKLSFISGLTAFSLIVAPFATCTFAAEHEDNSTVVNNVYEVPADVYGVRDVVYGGDVTDEVYYGDVTDNVYGEDVTDNVYGEDVTDNVYGDGVTEDVYEEVTDDVYGEDVTDNVYGEVTDDVYGDNVTDDVYGEEVTTDVYNAEAVLQTNDKGELVLDYSAHSAVNVTVTKESIEQFLQDSPNTKSITLNIGGAVEVQVPVALAKQGFELNAEPRNVKGAVSVVYDFTLVNLETGKNIDFKNNPITLTFPITGKVNNWNDVSVYFVKEGKLVEEAYNVTINKATKEVTAQVVHFSEYGVFEVASAPADTDESSDDKSTAGTKDNTSTTTNDSNKGSVDNTSDSNTNKTTEGHKLPVTATNSYNLLAFGLLIVAIGGVLLFVRNRRMA